MLSVFCRCSLRVVLVPQRRVLSAVMVEVVYYCREMLTDLINTWDTNKSFLTLDYVSTWPSSPPRC